jgi:VWFA-related protein
MKQRVLILSISLLFGALISISPAFSQDPTPTPQNRSQKVRTVSIPISIFSKRELKEREPAEFVAAGEIIVKEDDDQQTILSIRSNDNVPLSLAILIQDDLTSEFNLQLKDIADFIRRLPKGSRVMVAYGRSGTFQVRQKFTDDLEKAAKSLRIVSGPGITAAFDPYAALIETLDRFDSLPLGRRAVLMVSDGLDLSHGIDSSSPSMSLDLERAITKAQKRSVAVYTFYSAATATAGARGDLVLRGQGSLNKLADETGGRSFFQGSFSPISFDPFFRELVLALNRQFILTYLSTHLKKGYHKLSVTSTNPEVKIEHPKSYYYRKF